MKSNAKEQITEMGINTETGITDNNAYIKGRKTARFIKELDSYQCFVWLCCISMCLMLIVQA